MASATAATSLEDPPVSLCRSLSFLQGHIPHHPQEPGQMNLEISCSWFLSCRCQAGIQRVRTQTFNEGITPSPASKHLQCFIAEAQCHCHKMGRSMADRVRLVLEVQCHLLSDPYRAVPSPLVTALQSPDNSKKRREGDVPTDS